MCRVVEWRDTCWINCVIIHMLLMSLHREAAARVTSHHSHSSITDGLAATVQRQHCSCRAAHECGDVERTGRRPTAAATRVDTVDTTRNQLDHCGRVMRMSSCSSRVSVDSRSTSSATVHQQHDHFSMLLLLLLLSPSVQLHCRCRTSSVTCCSCTPTRSALLLLLLLLQFSTTILHRAPLPNGSLHNRHLSAVGRTVRTPASRHTHRTCARPLVR